MIKEGWKMLLVVCKNKVEGLIDIVILKTHEPIPAIFETDGVGFNGWECQMWVEEYANDFMHLQEYWAVEPELKLREIEPYPFFLLLVLGK